MYVPSRRVVCAVRGIGKTPTNAFAIPLCVVFVEKRKLLFNSYWLFMCSSTGYILPNVHECNTWYHSHKHTYMMYHKYIWLLLGSSSAVACLNEHIGILVYTIHAYNTNQILFIYDGHISFFFRRHDVYL